MGRKVEQMLRDLKILVEREYGTAASPDAWDRIARGLSEMRGGELGYIPKQTKSNTLSRVREYSTAVPASEVAKKIGVSDRYVRKIRSLMR